MATRDQIKKEFFLSLLKGPYEPTVEDIVVQAVISKDLYKKYQHDITADEYNEIGDELEEDGYFNWNADGHLALTTEGLNHLSKYHKR